MEYSTLTPIIFLAGALFVAIVMAAIRIGKPAARAIGYQKRDHLLSPAERSFFEVLQQAVGADYKVFCKVRIADVLTPQKAAKSEWQRAFNQIAHKHFDFLLCRNDTLEVNAAVELNDKSHLQESRGKRDQLVAFACSSAQLVLINIPAKRSYSIEALRVEITEAIRAASDFPSDSYDAARTNLSRLGAA